MSEVLTVPTIFGDLSDLAQGLVDRVEEEQIVLYGPNAYEEGAELDFSLLLADGSSGLEGRGVVLASVDGGEDRDPSTRFDIFIHSLQFEGVQEVVFERMVMARQAMSEGEEAPAAELDEVEEAVDELAAEAPIAEEPVAEEPVAEEPVEDDFGGFEDEATVVAGVEHAEALAAFEASAAEEAAAAEAAVAEPAAEEPEEPAFEAPVDEAPAEEAAFEAPVEEPAAEEPEPAASEPEPAFEAPVDEAPLAAAAADADDFADEPARSEDDDTVSSRGDSGAFSRPSEPPHTRSFAPPAPEHDLLRPAALDLELLKGAEAPEPPAPPAGFAVDNSLAGGLVRSHEVWSPVAPPPPEPRPSTGRFQYAAGPIPLPATPPRPDIDAALRVVRAPAPVNEGEAPARIVEPVRSAVPAAAAPVVNELDSYDEDEDEDLVGDSLDLDSVSADE